MRWLVTTVAGTPISRVREAVAVAGGRLDHDDAIPLAGGDGGAGELVLEVEGPGDLPERLRESPEVLDVYPDSEIELFSGGPDPV